VDNLFFTHHHFDHNINYPCFLLCRWDQAAGRGSDFNVYGPKLTLEGLPLANVSPRKAIRQSA
jgi:ribonuclease BN (tRNA processing enzyme)